MKKMEIKGMKSLVLFACLIFSFSFVSAFGVTVPHPQNIELQPGQSSYFTFQIQTDDFPVVCVPEIQDTNGLEIAFNQQYEIEANQRYNVKPQVIVPKQTPYGNFEAKFCLKCTPSSKDSSGGSRIISSSCGLPITVNVVAERTRDNMFDQTQKILVWVVLLIIVLIILVLALIVWMIMKKKK